MKDLLQKIVSAIVDEPEKLEIRQSDENGFEIFTILAPSLEIGKIIGKEGRVIKAIRTLCRLKAMKDNLKILIKVEPIDQKENGFSLPETSPDETAPSSN